MSNPMKKTRDPMARELRTPKYRPRVVPDKTKKLPRKRKHKNESNKKYEILRIISTEHTTTNAANKIKKNSKHLEIVANI
jgi:hypothetical protein